MQAFQILGCSAGIPTKNRGVSCVMLQTDFYDIMLDCGEGTYTLWDRSGYKWQHLRYILITHMHPDHVGGLLPFLFYRKLNNIAFPITIIGPPELKDFVTSMLNFCKINYKNLIKIIDVNKLSQNILDNKVQYIALPMQHKIPCWGYKLIDHNHQIVFITDTRPNRNSIKLAKNVDVLIHEATYDHLDRFKANIHFHSTQIEAMEIADKARVKKLILTHFSKRISNKELEKWVWNGQPCVIFDKKQKFNYFV